MVRQDRRPGSRLAALAVALALLSVGALGATLAVDEALRRALEISFRNALTRALYPWTVRLDLAVLLLLAASIGVLATGTGTGAGQDTKAAPRVDRRRLLLGSVPLAAVAVVTAVVISPVSAVAAVVLYGVALWVGPRLAGAVDPWLVPLLAFSFTLRAALAVALSLYGEPGHGRTTFDDEQAIHNAAHQVAAIMAAGVGDLDPEWRHLMGSQLDVMGTLYVLLGPEFTTFRLLNVCLSTLTIALVYAIADRWRGRGVARTASVLVALWPTLVLWGSTGLREPLSIALTLLFPWLLLRRFEAGGAGGAARPYALLAATTGALALLTLAVLRPPAAIALAVALLVSAPFVRWPDGGRLRRTLPVVGAALLGVTALALSWRLSRDPAEFRAQFTPRAVEYRQASAELTPRLESDRSKLPAQPDPSFMALSTLVRAVPLGRTTTETGVLYSYTLDPPGYLVLFDDGTLTPMAPSQVRALTDETIQWTDLLGRPVRALRLLFVPIGPGEPLQRLATAPDTVAWDALLLVAALAAVPALRRSVPADVVLVVYPFLMVLGLALLSTNLGTLVRHRGIVVPWLALLAAPILVVYAARLKQSTSARRLAVRDRDNRGIGWTPSP